MTKELGLYVHIPFCVSKCPYCDFYSLTDYNERRNKFKNRYIDSLILHMEDYSPSARSYTVDTVYIGGGTPSIIPVPSMLDLIKGIYDNFTISPDVEFTMEVNPATLDFNMLKKYRRAGINRISFGVQSSCDNELKALSRIHNFEECETSFALARRAGFNNISIDIMYGIPEQTKTSLRTTLDRICALEPEHISLYGLKIEENTPFAQIQDSLRVADEDDELVMYMDSVGYLEEQGYIQYEISNFAREGHKCKHNLKYWNCEDYLGLGPAAHSYYNGTRFSFKRDVEMYVEAIENTEQEFDLTDEYFEISETERVGEYIMLRMRLTDGINADKFHELFGLDFEKLYGDFLTYYVKHGFVQKRQKNYSFTLNGMFVSNYILSEMLDFNERAVSKIVNGLN